MANIALAEKLQKEIKVEGWEKDFFEITDCVIDIVSDDLINGELKLVYNGKERVEDSIRVVVYCYNKLGQCKFQDNWQSAVLQADGTFLLNFEMERKGIITMAEQIKVAPATDTY